jgi:hypothetical protein
MEPGDTDMSCLCGGVFWGDILLSSEAGKLEMRCDGVLRGEVRSSGEFGSRDAKGCTHRTPHCLLEDPQRDMPWLSQS